jgi:hypothetical protein
VVVVEPVERVVEAVGHGPVDGVSLRLPLHGDDQHVAVAFGADQIGHPVPPSTPQILRRAP